MDPEEEAKAQAPDDDYVGTILVRWNAYNHIYFILTVLYFRQDLSTSLQNSILAHRIVAETYQAEEDYENVIKTAEIGLELADREEQSMATKLPR